MPERPQSAAFNVNFRTADGLAQFVRFLIAGFEDGMLDKDELNRMRHSEHAPPHGDPGRIPFLLKVVIEMRLKDNPESQFKPLLNDPTPFLTALEKFKDEQVVLDAIKDIKAIVEA